MKPHLESCVLGPQDKKDELIQQRAIKIVKGLMYKWRN